MPADNPVSRPALILTCGLMGTGKSTIAKEISKITGFKIFRSDEIRKELAGMGKGKHRYEPFGEGIYSEEYFDLTYEAIFKKASERLKKGMGVIVDASFKKSRYREKGRKLAQKAAVPFLIVECKCPEEEIKKRLTNRFITKSDVSDGRWELFEDQRRDFEEITDRLSEREHFVINTADDPDSIAKILSEKLNALLMNR